MKLNKWMLTGSGLAFIWYGCFDSGLLNSLLLIITGLAVIFVGWVTATRQVRRITAYLIGLVVAWELGSMLYFLVTTEHGLMPSRWLLPWTMFGVYTATIVAFGWFPERVENGG